jgi:hypothetical protein
MSSTQTHLLLPQVPSGLNPSRTYITIVQHAQRSFLMLLLIIVDRAPCFVACSYRTTNTPPTNIAQERIKRRKFILDTVPREHVEVLKQRRDNFLYTHGSYAMTNCISRSIYVP